MLVRIVCFYAFEVHMISTDAYCQLIEDKVMIYFILKLLYPFSYFRMHKFVRVSSLVGSISKMNVYIVNQFEIIQF